MTYFNCNSKGSETVQKCCYSLFLQFKNCQWKLLYCSNFQHFLSPRKSIESTFNPVYLSDISVAVLTPKEQQLSQRLLWIFRNLTIWPIQAKLFKFGFSLFIPNKQGVYLFLKHLFLALFGLQNYGLKSILRPKDSKSQLWNER